MSGPTDRRPPALLAILIVLGGLGVLLVLGTPLLLIAIQAGREAAARKKAVANLAQIGQALQNYHEKHASRAMDELSPLELPALEGNGADGLLSGHARPVKLAAPDALNQSPVTESDPLTERGEASVNAEVQMTSAFERAKVGDKCVLVHLGAPWCGWCKRLEEFLDANAALFADDYIILKIDVEEMEHGDEIAGRLRGDRTGGIPWFAILDADGTELVSSDGPEGNIGCPVSKAECAYFVSMIEKTIRHSPEGRVAEIAEVLEVFAEPRR